MSLVFSPRRGLPTRGALKLAVAGTLLVAAVLGSSDVPPPATDDVAMRQSSASTAAAFVPGVEVQLGPEELLLGPSGHVDSPYFSERDAAGRLFGVMGNADTSFYSSRNNARLSNPRIVLRKGKTGAFDGCGAWLLPSIHKVTPRHWVGWYHAEQAGAGDGGTCNYGDQSTVWRIAFTQSTDAGRTWTKPTFRRANNYVITQNSALTDRSANSPWTEDAGNGRVMRIGAFFYLFYMAASAETDRIRYLHVARSPVEKLGKPGTWQKYYCHDPLVGPVECGFTQPGVGGKSSHIGSQPNELAVPSNARFVTWNNYLGRYIGVQATGTVGFNLYMSELSSQAEAWKRWSGAVRFYPPVSRTKDPLVDQWGVRTSRARHLYAYPSILGVDGGNSVTGQDFYLYYMKLFPGDDFTHRYLFRRKVSLVKTASNAGLHRVQLTTYLNKTDGRRRSSTERPQAKAYRFERISGYLLAVERPGWVPVLECVGPRSRYYLRKSSCSSTHREVRLVGWISPTKTASAPVQVFTCFNRPKRNSFVSTSQTCSGARRTGVLGFALPALR